MLLFGCFLVLDLWIYIFFFFFYSYLLYCLPLQLQFRIHSKFLFQLLVKALLFHQISGLNTQIMLVIPSMLPPPPHTQHLSPVVGLYLTATLGLGWPTVIFSA